MQESSTFTGLDPQTLRKMFDNSQITGYKTPKGQRRIDKSSLQQLCFSNIYDEKEQTFQRKNYLYARVSTKKQMDDLSRQVKFLQQPQYSDYILIQDYVLLNAFSATLSLRFKFSVSS